MAVAGVLGAAAIYAVDPLREKSQDGPSST